MELAEQLGSLRVQNEHLLLAGLAVASSKFSKTLDDAGITRDRLLRAVESRSAAENGDNAVFVIRVDDDASTSITEQIITQIQEAIVSGQAVTGDRLPTVRGLAEELDIAPGTVARAYQELERRGLITTDGARGTRVASSDQWQTREENRAMILRDLLRRPALTALGLGASADEVRRVVDELLRELLNDA
jgi:DNA-binding transcriptional regulator YhcF (GntR family)